MTIEAATYLNTLDDTYPASSDAKSEGDNHIRQLKTVLQATFPNIAGAVTPTHTQLNTVPDLAPKASPTFTGTPVAPTAATVDSSTQLATTANVDAKILAAALSAELPSQTGNAGKVITTDGTTATWGAGGVTRSARTSNTILGFASKSYLIDITSGTFTQTFDAVATLGDGWFVYLKNSGTGDITLDPNASETIDGLATFIMYPGEVRLIQCDGSALRSVVVNSFYKTFTASGDFTKPPGYTRFDCMLWGAGGSGRKHSTGSNKAGGGGGGCAVFTRLASLLAATESVVIGAGGTAVSADNTDGNAGGTSTFAGFSAYGGAVANSSGGTGGNAFVALGAGDAAATGGATTSKSAYLGGGAGLIAAGANGVTIYGGGGAGGITSGDVLVSAPGTIYGGAGGAAVLAGAGGVAGTAPGGGGGATKTGTASGAGAVGEFRIWGVI